MLCVTKTIPDTTGSPSQEREDGPALTREEVNLLEEQMEMYCFVCDNNFGYCNVLEAFSTSDEEEKMLKAAWIVNNAKKLCLFWSKGRKRKTHEGML